jgi:hypothetical protein
MFDFFAIGFWMRDAIANIANTLNAILKQLNKLEQLMSELDTTINQRLDVIEGAINIETEQASQLQQAVSQLTAEVAALREQLAGQITPISEATLQRIEALSGKISAIVPDAPE